LQSFKLHVICRFNLEQQAVNILYDYSPSPSSNSSSDIMVGDNQNSVISGDRIFQPEVTNVAKFMRRNSENSIGIKEIQNLVKNGKLKPLYGDNVKVVQQTNKGEF